MFQATTPFFLRGLSRTMWPLYCVQSKKLWRFEAKSRGFVRGKGLLPDVEAGTTKTWTAAAADLGRGTLLSFMVLVAW